MDDLDRRIIKELQGNFPLETNPYDILAEGLGIDVDELWRRIVDLVESGFIRRIGFSIDSRKMGYSSTLAAIRVASGQIDKACELIDRCPQITHSYLREDAFNIWFTVIAEDQDQICHILDRIKIELALTEEDVMNLPVEKLYKLDARFK